MQLCLKDVSNNVIVLQLFVLLHVVIEEAALHQIDVAAPQHGLEATVKQVSHKGNIQAIFHGIIIIIIFYYSADVNECARNTDNCQQVCVNTNGGFRCACNTGYLLNSDGRTCRGNILYNHSLCTCGK